jgi:Phosphate-selective porin O and P
VAFGPPAVVDDPAPPALAPTVAFNLSAKNSFTDILTTTPKLQFRDRIEVDSTLPGRSAAYRIGRLQGGYGFRWAGLGAEGIGSPSAWVAEFGLAGGAFWLTGDAAIRLGNLGGSIALRLPFKNVVEFAPEGQSNLVSASDNLASPLSPSLSIPVNCQQLCNLHSAAVAGPISAQAEWFATTVHQTCRGGVHEQGAYDHGSLFLTGEHWGDDAAWAEFSELAARNPMGRSVGGGVSGPSAVELAVRFSVTNTASHILPPGQPSTAVGANSGTILYEESWGVNWYLNTYTRIMANYTFAVPTTHGSPALPVRTFGLRTAIWW